MCDQPSCVHAAENPPKGPSMRRVRTLTLLIAAVVAGAHPVGAQGLPGDGAKRADGGQRALVNASAAFAGKTLRLVGGCTHRLLDCLETKVDGAKRNGCVAKASAKCRTALAGVTGEEAKLATAITAKCSALGI